jgi:phosphoribosylformimino-5-aminoimidazole carboxamide ribotide isomerase
MIIFPAIDILGGQVVRLEQGKRELCTVYGESPVAMALQWQAEGAQYLHLVDLDGAFTGEPLNLAHVAEIVQSVRIPVQLGGGMRSADTVRAALGVGVSRVILGTKACESLPFVAELVKEFGGPKIAVGIDAKEGRVAVKGWTESTALLALDLAKQVAELGVETIIYTDIATDGMFTGPNYPSLRELHSSVSLQVIASGGIGTAAHVQELREIPGLYGAIVGKALYDRKLKLADILSSA